jgi:hypothetical protein
MTKKETQLLKELREIKERLAEIEKRVAAPSGIPYPIYIPSPTPTPHPWPWYPPIIWWSSGTGTTAPSVSASSYDSAMGTTTEALTPVTLTQGGD